MSIHFHVATGLSGYGPDGDYMCPFADVTEAAEAVRFELAQTTDRVNDDATSYAEAGEFENAYNSLRLIDAIEIMSMNLDGKRSEAPLYVGKPELWEASLTGIIGDNFPMDLDVEGNVRLYVWTCTETDCDEVSA